MKGKLRGSIEGMVGNQSRRDQSEIRIVRDISESYCTIIGVRVKKLNVFDQQQVS